MEKSNFNRVVCITDEWHIEYPAPKKGEIYTVRKTIEHKGVLYYLLKGFPTNHAYGMIGFRPLEDIGLTICECIARECEEIQAPMVALYTLALAPYEDALEIIKKLK